jgi:hypothetical protein
VALRDAALAMEMAVREKAGGSLKDLLADLEHQAGRAAAAIKAAIEAGSET